MARIGSPVTTSTYRINGARPVDITPNANGSLTIGDKNIPAHQATAVLREVSAATGVPFVTAALAEGAVDTSHQDFLAAAVRASAAAGVTGSAVSARAEEASALRTATASVDIAKAFTDAAE